MTSAPVGRDGQRVKVKRRRKKGVTELTEETREREEGKCLFFSFFPADPLPLLRRPPRLLPLWAARWLDWAQTALLPVSMLALLALANTKAAVVGGHQPDEVQRETGHAAFEGLARAHLPRYEQGEPSLASWRCNCSQEKHINVRP